MTPRIYIFENIPRNLFQFEGVYYLKNIPSNFEREREREREWQGKWELKKLKLENENGKISRKLELWKIFKKLKVWEM